MPVIDRSNDDCRYQIYEAREESLYDSGRLPYMIRDPDGRFSRWWDVLIVMLTLWTSVMVPLRTCTFVYINQNSSTENEDSSLEE